MARQSFPSHILNLTAPEAAALVVDWLGAELAGVDLWVPDELTEASVRFDGCLLMCALGW